jgi:hypothetical protein
MINKEFIPYELALELKQLGFDKPCFGVYFNSTQELFIGKKVNQSTEDVRTLAPTYSQAFRWFREKYDLVHYIDRNDDKMIEYVKSKGVEDLFKYRCGYSDGTFHNIKGYHTYEEAELACLKKLIELVKSPQG